MEMTKAVGQLPPSQINLITSTMNAKEILKKVPMLPGFPWGADVFFGRSLYEYADEQHAEFFDVTHHFDPLKEYFVIWDRFAFREFIDIMGPHDLLIVNGNCKKYAWEISK